MLYIVKGRTSNGIDLALLDSDSKVVLIEDGVYLNVSSLKGKAEVYALEKDVEKRGLSDRLDGVELIDYDGLVDLIEENKVGNF